MWLYGFPTSKPMYHTFARMNHARRRARAYPPFLSTLVTPHNLDTHSVLLSKPPLATVLTNVGSRSTPLVYYLPSSATQYAPRMAVIDVLTGQIFATDPSGGLAVTLVAGEPRSFLPLGIWEGRPQVVWQAVQQHHGISSPGRKKASTGSSTPGHSRGSSLSSMFGWLRGSKD